MLLRDRPAMESLVMRAITEKRYNKNLDIHWREAAFEACENQCFAVAVPVTIRTLNQVGSFNVAIEAHLVPSEEYMTASKYIKPTIVMIRDFSGEESDIPALESIFMAVTMAMTTKWTAEVFQVFDVKPSDLFVVYHAIFKSLGHLVGKIHSEASGILVLEFSSDDLKLKASSSNY
jgi:hypothetical protein